MQVFPSNRQAEELVSAYTYANLAAQCDEPVLCVIEHDTLEVMNEQGSYTTIGTDASRTQLMLELPRHMPDFMGAEHAFNEAVNHIEEMIQLLDIEQIPEYADDLAFLSHMYPEEMDAVREWLIHKVNLVEGRTITYGDNSHIGARSLDIPPNHEELNKYYAILYAL